MPHPLCLLLLPLVIACTTEGSAEDVAGKESAAVEITTVGRQDIARTVSYAADLRPWVVVEVTTTVSDRVLSFPFQDGDAVRAGEHIALIRRSNLDKGLEQIAAQIESLDAQIRTQAQDIERQRELLAGGVVTQQTFDKLTSALEASEAQRRALQASLDQLSLTAGEASVISPITGVVADRSVDVGDRAVPSVPICSVMQVDPLKVVLDLAESDARLVHAGDVVRLAVDAWPGRTFEGSVSRVRPYLEPSTRTNTVEVRVDNPADQDGERPLKPGMFGRATLTLDRRAQAVVVPEQALLLDPLLLGGDTEQRRAFVVEEGAVARERVVTLGIHAGTAVEVREGLAAGETLVLRGQHRLHDGDSVRVVVGGPAGAPAEEAR